MELIKLCGFKTIEDAIDYVTAEHGVEFARDGVMTVYVYKVTEYKKV